MRYWVRNAHAVIATWLLCAGSTLAVSCRSTPKTAGAGAPHASVAPPALAAREPALPVGLPAVPQSDAAATSPLPSAAPASDMPSAKSPASPLSPYFKRFVLDYEADCGVYPRPFWVGDDECSPRLVDATGNNPLESTGSQVKGRAPTVVVRFSAWDQRPKSQGSASSSSSSGEFELGSFFGVVGIETLGVRQTIFHTTNTEMHQCFVAENHGEIRFECIFDGAGLIIGRGVVRVAGNQLELAWCTAMRGVLDQGRRTFTVRPGTQLRLSAPEKHCYPASPWPKEAPSGTAPR